jgi:hypothetical protein
MRPHDIGWYLQGNQLDPSRYLATQTERIALYQYELVLPEPTLAVMSKVAAQPGAPARAEPAKFQYLRPAFSCLLTRGLGSKHQRRAGRRHAPPRRLIPQPRRLNLNLSD